VQFRHRTEDARLEIVAGLPADARVVTRLNGDLREGRRATVVEAGQ
jgi:HlyD family secretion protein